MGATWRRRTATVVALLLAAGLRPDLLTATGWPWSRTRAPAGPSATCPEAAAGHLGAAGRCDTGLLGLAAAAGR